MTAIRAMMEIRTKHHVFAKHDVISIGNAAGVQKMLQITETTDLSAPVGDTTVDEWAHVDLPGDTHDESPNDLLDQLSEEEDGDWDQDRDEPWY
jgi:hypothetical protein